MTNEQLIEKFNPANGSNVSEEDLAILHELTDEQIDVLAEAYPNTPTRRSYLRIYDKRLPLEKQLYQLSTWQNLRNVRKFANQKSLIAWDFYSTATKFQQAPRPTHTSKASSTSPKKVTVDLTAQEAAEELKKNLKKPEAPKEKTAPTKPAGKAAAAGKNKLKAVPLQESGADQESIPDDEQFGNGGTE